MEGGTLAEKLWSSKEALLQTIKFINIIKPHVLGQFWNAKEDEVDCSHFSSQPQLSSNKAEAQSGHT